MRSLSDGVKPSGVQSIEDLPACAGFENRLDAVDALLLQVIDLLPGFVGGSRNTRKLFFSTGSNIGGETVEVFRAMASRSREQRATGEYLRAQSLSAVNRGAHFQNAVQSVAHASHRGHPTVKIGGQFTQHALLQIVLAHVRIESAG